MLRGDSFICAGAIHNVVFMRQSPKVLLDLGVKKNQRIEKNFGATLGISDERYGNSGGYTRDSLFTGHSVIAA